MKKFFVLFFFVSVSAAFAVASSEGKIFSVGEFKQAKVPLGSYKIQGYLVDIFTCPPCPKEGLCSPCPPDYIVISDKEKKNEDRVAEDELVISYAIVNAEKLSRGKKYLFTVNKTSQGIDSWQMAVQFVDASPIAETSKGNE